MTRRKTINFYFFSRMGMLCIAVLFSLLWIAGCSDDDDGSPGPTAPTITGINPESGPVGTEVTITGTNFSTTASDNKVTFNDVAASVNSATATQIKAVVPANATTGPVKVTVGGETATGPEFTVESEGGGGLTISSIEPNSGAVNDSITISGTGFSTTLEDNKVTFTDGVAATVAKASDTAIVVLVPEEAVTGPITVAVGENTATSPGDFTVNPAATLVLDPVSGAVGTEITITGVTFSTTPEENTVTFFDGKVATVTAATDTSLVVTVPAESVSGPVTVVVGEETYVSEIFTVTTANGLGITSIDPEEGETGDTIAISGVGFSATLADNTVSFAGETDPVAAEIITASDTLLEVKIPDGAITGPVSVTVGGETVTSGEFIVSANGGGGEGTYMVTTFAGTNGNGFNDGVPAGEASFNQPFDLAVDSEGNVYVGDTRNHRVRKIAADGSLVTTFAGGGCDDPSQGCYKDGSGTAAGFYQPSGLAFDSEGNLYVTDNQNHRLRMIAPDGTVTTIAGNGSKGVKDGTGGDAQFSSPYAVYVNPDGEIFVSDFAGHTIRKVTPAGEVTVYAGQANSAGQDDGEKLAATFDGPVPITGDADGNLYIGDFGSGLIRKIASDGQVTTLAGTNDEFGEPAGLAFKDGVLYVADREQNKIFKVSESGEVSLVAGTDTSGGKNGEGSVAQFDGPNGLAFDKDGNLLVTEHGSNGRIRKITIP